MSVIITQATGGSLAPLIKTGVASATGVFIPAFEVGNYGFFTITGTTTGAWVDAAGQAGLVAVEGTNDPTGVTGWTALRMENLNAQSTTAMRNGGSYSSEVTTRWLRVNCLVFKAGTFSANLIVFSIPRQLIRQNIKDVDGLASVEVTPGTGQLHIAQRTFLVGGNFDGSSLDTSVWTSAGTTGSGSAVLSGGTLTLSTGTTANSIVRVQSLRNANLLAGASNIAEILLATDSAGVTGCVKRWGLFDDNNGVFFEQYFDGISGQLNIKTRKAGVDSSPVSLNGINNVANNGFGVPVYSLFELVVDPLFVKAKQNGILAHLFSGLFPTLFAKFDFPFRFEVINSGGATTNNKLFVQNAGAFRLGLPESIRADESFKADDVLSATAAVIQGQKPDGTFSQVGLDTDADLQVSARQITDSGNSSVLTSSTTVTSRSVTDGVVTAGSDIVTSATAAFIASDVGSRIDGILPDMYIQNVVSSTQARITSQATVSSTGTSLTISRIFIGTPFKTRSRNIQENLTTVVAVNSAGNISNIGGCLTFNYHPDSGGSAGTATIVQPSVIRSFAEVRNVGWLSNAGDYYSVLFTPSRAITSGETIIVTTVHSKLAGNDFKRVANQVIEEENATVTTIQSFIKAFGTDGNSVNIRATPSEALRVDDDSIFNTPSGSTFVEGILDTISHIFSVSQGTSAISRLQNGSTGTGSVSLDTVEGQAVFSTGLTANSKAAFFSEKAYTYETGHGIISGQSIRLETLPTGNAFVEWGASDVSRLNGTGIGIDATGFYSWRMKNGVYESKTYQPNWNRDKANGVYPSLFKFNNSPQKLNGLKNNIYYKEFEWFGSDTHTAYIKPPQSGSPLPIHVEEYPNQNTGSSLPDPNIFLFISVNNGTSGVNLKVRSGSWHGGEYSNRTIATGKNPNNDFGDVRIQGRHFGNTTNIPLDATQTYRGIWFEWQDSYVGMAVDMTSDVAGTLYVDFSQVVNPVNGDDSNITGTPISFIYDPVATPLLRKHLPIQSRWVRIRYVNGIAAQSILSIDAAFLTSSAATPYQQLSQVPLYSSLAGMNQDIIVAEREELANTFVHVKTTRNLDNKDGLNVNVTKFEDDVLLEALPTWSARQISLGITPVWIDTNKLTNRRAVQIKNHSPSFNIYIGPTSSVSQNNGELISPLSISSMMLSTSGDVWGVVENTSGTQTILDRTASSGTTGSLTSNDVYATISANGQTVVTDTYVAGTTNPLVSVKIGIEGKKDTSPATETVAHQETQPGNTAGAGTVVSASLAGGIAQLYVVSISRNTSTGTVTAVTGAGLTFTNVVANLAFGNNRLDVWKAYGNAAAGAITASLSTSTNAHIAVSRFTNADPTTPIQANATNTGTGTSVTGTGITGTNLGMAMLIIAHDDTSGTQGTGYTERSDQTNGTGSNKDGLATETKPLVSTGTETGTYTLATSAAWGTIGLTITPVTTNAPVMSLFYNLSGIRGVTSGSVSFSTTSDVVSFVDITPDRTWVVADIPNVQTVASGTNIGVAAAKVDQLFLRLTDSTGNSARVSLKEIA